MEYHPVEYEGPTYFQLFIAYADINLLERATAAAWHERVQLGSQIKLLVTFVNCHMCAILFHQNHLSFIHIDS